MSPVPTLVESHSSSSAWAPGQSVDCLHGEVFASSREGAGAGLALALALDRLAAQATAPGADWPDERRWLWVQDRQAMRRTGLPYRPEVLDLIRQAAAQGTPVILASASHWRNVRRIARHFGLDDQPIATTRRNNLKGEAKLAAIRARLGDGKTFAYIGDSRADLPVWRAAAQAWTTGFRPRSSQITRLGPPPRPLWQVIAKALRPHQWAKNGLVLVPLVTSALFLSVPDVLAALGAMVCM
ncbi:MAG TPA: haloacid dehalogenase-like hydrolase, partial [Novosphingobium sp.]|nr:haloacid dehalogenase-like hydrolase [Novosphingobium sp.]